MKVEPNVSLYRILWAEMSACAVRPYVTRRRLIFGMISCTFGSSRQMIAAPKNGTLFTKSVKHWTTSSIPLYDSMCSLSIFVTTAIVGYSIRNDRSLSSASVTNHSELPSFAFEPSVSTTPPTTVVGSNPAWPRMVATIEVVEVFPCVPETATA